MSAIRERAVACVWLGILSCAACGDEGPREAVGEPGASDPEHGTTTSFSSLPKSEADACEEYGVDLDCRSIAAISGRTARLTGRLVALTGHGAATPYQEIRLRGAEGVAVSGKLSVIMQSVGQAPDPERLLRVEGKVTQSALYARALDSDKTLSADLWGLPGHTSSAPTPSVKVDGIDYSLDCTSGFRPALPGGADLILGGEVTFTAGNQGYYTVHVPILNQGNQPATIKLTDSLFIRLKDPTRTRAGYFGDEEQVQTLYDPTTGANVERIEPGMVVVGDILVSPYALQRCTTMYVRIDSRGQFQSGPFDAFANDEAAFSSPCLTWNTPITPESLGSLEAWQQIPADIRQNLAADGMSLERIVASAVVARPDGKRCNACHYAGSTKVATYRPEIAQNYHHDLSDLLSNRKWDDLPGPGKPMGWGLAFLTRPNPPPTPRVEDENRPSGDKPRYLQKIVERWVLDGMHSSPADLPRLLSP